MVTRLSLPLAAVLAAGSLPATAAVFINQADVAANTLIVSGQVSPPAGPVVLSLGTNTQIVVQPDATGWFAWIDALVPPGCVVTASVGSERAKAGVGHCGPGDPPYPVPTGVTQYGSSGAWRGDEPAPGIGVERTTAERSTTVERTTTVRRTRPLIISPNDPRYAQTEPPHWGQPDEQGWHSGELADPERPHGFYAPVRSKEDGGGN